MGERERVRIQRYKVLQSQTFVECFVVFQGTFCDRFALPGYEYPYLDEGLGQQTAVLVSFLTITYSKGVGFRLQLDSPALIGASETPAPWD